MRKFIQERINPNIKHLQKSATLAINDRSRELINAGKTVWKFGLGQSPFPVPTPVVEALKLHAHEKDYLPVEGLRELREAVSEFCRVKEGIHAHPDNILIGPGSKELLFLLQLAFQGTLIVPSPCWVSYMPQAHIIGKKIQISHTHFEEKWRLSPARLQQICEQELNHDNASLLVLNYPGNPDGDTYSVPELQQIAEIARQYNLVILSDEIYGQLHHKGEHVSIARFYPEGTILSSGISKWCGAGGWRLGTFIFPPDLKPLRQAMAVIASETYTSVSTPIQCAAVSAFRGGMEIERYLFNCRRILAILGREIYHTLTANQIKLHPPTGAFYLFIDFSHYAEPLAEQGITTSTDLCDRLLQETGVAILPGAAFGRPPEELTARLAYVNFDGNEALLAAEQVAPYDPLPDDFTRQWCAPVITGIEHLIAWVNAL